MAEAGLPSGMPIVVGVAIGSVALMIAGAWWIDRAAKPAPAASAQPSASSPASPVSSETKPYVPPADPPRNDGIVELAVGTGALATPGDKVTLHYVGKFVDGKVFDDSTKRGTPFTFTLGSGAVIKGFDRGITGMRVGGKRRVTIPPEEGYGAKGAGATIPPNATLVFEIELLDVKKP